MSIMRVGRVVAISGMMIIDLVLLRALSRKDQLNQYPRLVVMAVACLHSELRKVVSVSLLFRTIKAK